QRVDALRALFELPWVQREPQRQQNDHDTHQPEGAKAPTGDEAHQQIGGEGASPIAPGDPDSLPDKDADIGQQQDEQRGKRKASLEALLYLSIRLLQRRKI